jgi:DNA-binding GntR family transcriptional regulator
MSIVDNWTIAIFANSPHLHKTSRSLIVVSNDHAAVHLMDQRTIDRKQQQSPRRRHGERTRTIPEQIADHISHAIINGEYRGGERIREQELATLYGVSRAPVREAIRALQERGLVLFLPRRGAYVVEITLETVVEVFNVRAVLMGLAARDLTRRKDAQFVADLRAGIAEAQQLARTKSASPQSFARAIARLGGLVATRCGNQHLSRLLRHQLDHTLWGFIWRDRPLDYFTPQRQAAAVREWEDLATAIEAGEEGHVEALQRRIFFNSRDAAIKTLRKTRDESVSRHAMIRD